ncbi:MAG: hypothetical protein KGN34_09585 [Sphingomonadales bacterium]|nr:hypothetical protein [Sphingomonadales bacterium]
MTTFKRKVLHLGGFDPRGARFYHELLGEQVDAHNAAGLAPALALGERRRQAKDSAWTVTAADESCITDIRFLAWDDLVRAHWIKGTPALIRHMATAYRRFWRAGEWTITGNVPRGSKFALVYPGVTMLLAPLLATLLVWGLLAIGLRFAGLSGWWGLPPALAAGIPWGLSLVKRIHSLWLMRFIVFNDQLACRETLPALDDRLDRFAAAIAEALDEPHDEVLFVTHSNGSILAMPIMARVLARRGGALPENFALVTLGSSIPLISFRRDALGYHAACDAVGQARFRWLDIGSLTDGAAIPLVPPLLGRPVEAPAGLVQLSPRWFRYCNAATYKLRRRNKYLTHFDYLRRLDRPSPLDYLGLTCSGRPLAQSIAAFEAENA